MSCTCHSNSSFLTRVLVISTGLLLLMTAPALAVTFTENTYIGPTDTTYDNDDIIVDGCTLTVDGAHPFNSLQIINGGIVTHSANADVQEFTLDLTIATNVTVETGSRIDVDGKGYSSSEGPGQGEDHGTYGAGAGHGGNGGNSSAAAGGSSYGSILQPTDIGSGGGRTDTYQQGGPGGGAVRLVVNGTLTIDGDITANGADGGIVGSNYGGGGSGGSIYMTAAVLTGGGTVSAIGGNAALVTSSGGGAGGRIALYADDFGGFGWSTPAHGGDGYVRGGAGTAYFKETAAASGILVVDNNTAVGAWTPLTSPEAFDLAIRHAAIAYPTEAMTIGDLMINDDSVLTHSSGGPGIDLTIQGDATIDPGATINVSGRGYGSSSGPGEGGDHETYAAGAGYGGTGANSTGATGGLVYGSITEPTDLGSGGGRTDSYEQGGAGGGALHLNVVGTLTLEGALIANGNDGGIAGSNWGGGGSGGSIYVQADSLEGSGSMSANGGGVVVDSAGGGGGGRIAIYYDTANTYSGTITAYGGGITRVGGAGTIYIHNNSDTVGDLYVDNNGNSYAYTDLPATYPAFGTVQVGAGAVLGVPAEGTVTMADLAILANGTVLHRGTTLGGIHLDVANDATIALDGKIDVSGRGFGSRSGPGAGGDGSNNGCGGGHAGVGGRSSDGTARGVASDGAFAQPDTLGSGGGGDNDGQNVAGGAGGGAVQLTVGGNLVVEGQILADGNVGGIVGSETGGGGSGGSVWITADSLSGAGMISADGGDGGSIYAGGGGGGHVAVYATTDTFAGTVTTCGGAGYEIGGAGTVYLESGGSLGYALSIDNCAAAGYITELPGVLQIDNNLVVSNNAQLTHSGELTVDGDLAVETGGEIHHHTANTNGLQLIVTGDTSVDAASKIDVSVRGYAPQSGPGAGESTYQSGAGGGYGGPGGNGSNTTGGLTYGSFTEPADLGSGAGEELDAGNSGGYGGGAVRLSVTGTLVIEGELLANGGTSTGTSGQDHAGGSGGSIWLTAGTLTGAGSISANGGNHSASPEGGGGGGGRIAVYCDDTTGFSGTLTACGGIGYGNGGAGTVYIEATAGQSALILDNCGTSGAETNLPGVSSVDNNMIVRNNATLIHTGDLTIDGDLTVEDTALITQPVEQGASHFTITGDTTIDAGGRISVSERGHAPQNGPGAGGSSTSSGAGGGYGGPGGNGSNTTGGGIYGSITEPTDLGSGGGEETDSAYDGGHGGGAMRLSVTGTLNVNGDLTADGGHGEGTTNSDNGGGSGGSIWITTTTLTGVGPISANGGNGNLAAADGGGGGGGRIAIYCDDTAGYTGGIAVHAGTGYQNGGAGTIYTKTSAQTYGNVLYDNGGISGVWTPLTETDPFTYTIANGAIVYPTEALTVSGIHVASGGTLTHLSGDDSFYLNVQGDVTIDAGGAIQANGRGHGSSSGPGQGSDGSTYGAGAGYGGAGGDSTQATGGSTYGIEWTPNLLGSGGGKGDPYDIGGAGGGIVFMNVAGALQVDGQLAANGNDGGVYSGNYGGGGSGGSIWLRVESLDGTGVITANGGSAQYASAGGGGGGRIAIFTCDLQMSTSQITATGGAGYEVGADGTIFYGSNTIEITLHPQDQIAFVDDPVTFTVAATGEGTLSYQWRKDGVDLVDDGRITGSQTDTLSIVTAELTDQGNYYVVVTDDCGPFSSDWAFLTVPPPGDMNCDGAVNAYDIDGFICAVSPSCDYEGLYPHCDRMLGDMNGDGSVNSYDIDGFITAVGGG
ncbi:MAG: immunoglobulin domain-containing protein [Planctomycetota bacterium]